MGHNTVSRVTDNPCYPLPQMRSAHPARPHAKCALDAITYPRGGITQNSPPRPSLQKRIARRGTLLASETSCQYASVRTLDGPTASLNPWVGVVKSTTGPVQNIILSAIPRATEAKFGTAWRSMISARRRIIPYPPAQQRSNLLACKCARDDAAATPTTYGVASTPM